MHKKRQLAVIVAIPLLLFGIFSGLKYGYISPMVKGIDIRIIGGTFITNVNKYVIKLGDTVSLSPGEYIMVPEFAKKPKLKFAVLDNKSVISIEGDKLTANKVGYASIGVLNKNRVLRKATIMVVNPKITRMQVNFDKPLKYYGDKSKISANIDIDDFKKLEGGYKFKYSATNDKVLKVDDNKVEAVGVGEAKLISRYDRKESQTTIKIEPKVYRLEMDDVYNIEVGNIQNLNTRIATLPKDMKTNVSYRVINSSKYDINKKVAFGESGLETTYGIDLDDKGNIKANRLGTYLVEARSGDKVDRALVNVAQSKFENIEPKNPQYRYEIKDGKLNIELGWDHDRRINTYDIYVKDRIKGEDYSLYTKSRVDNTRIPFGNRLAELLRFDIGVGSDFDYDVYIVGKNYAGEKTKDSRVLNISSRRGSDFQKKKVRNLEAISDRENSTVKLKWTPIDKGRYSYRVYYTDRDHKEANYRLMAKNIQKNTTTLKINRDNINYDFYIIAVNENGQISDFSKAVNVKSNFSE